MYSFEAILGLKQDMDIRSEIWYVLHTGLELGLMLKEPIFPDLHQGI